MTAGNIAVFLSLSSPPRTDADFLITAAVAAILFFWSIELPKWLTRRPRQSFCHSRACALDVGLPRMKPFLWLRDEDWEQGLPLPSGEEEEEGGHWEPLPDALPILPLRNTVLFPGVVVPITAGREKSLRLLRDSVERDQLVGVVAQKDPNVDDPGPEDLYQVGTIVKVLKIIRVPDGSQSVVIQGRRRFAILDYLQTEPYLVARIEPIEEAFTHTMELEALVRSIKELATQIINLSPNIPNDAAYAIQNIENPAFLIHFIASNLQLSVAEKQRLLEVRSLEQRAEMILEHLNRELQVLRLSEEIRNKVRSDIERQQREYFLRQQLKTIQEELGEADGPTAELAELRKRAVEKALPEETRQTLERELKRLERIPPMSPEYTVTRNYIDWILDLPWQEYSEDVLDLKRAQEILDEDHFDLERVKKRILEYLAVLKLKGDMKAPILCFYGPPGVGKTSLGKSIARALGRKFVRISLGGVRDEAEIRGHRRTYVGALPGRIIQGLRKAGTANPVFMLDEIDKLGLDFRGDPASALLEVLDPEQNATFSDHYLELPFDLSRVMFIATANYLDTIPTPLRDRMEIIEIPGYTQEDKLQIARRHLIPKQLAEHGLKPDQLHFAEGAIRKLIQDYTREAGVRNLERSIAAICRGVAKEVATGELAQSVTIDEGAVRRYLGPEKYFNEVAERTETPGVATGLAWTPTGGDLLFIEATAIPGSGRLILTGQLGEVMKESAQAAWSYVKAHARELGLAWSFFKHWDVHVHVPAGAVPKDGPSAGVTILTALVSLLTQRRARSDVAMTGEITLRGLVLPVGGIKEKVLAARRAGISRVILPARNEKDLEDVPEEARRELQFHWVWRVEEVLELALEPKPIADPQQRFAPPEPEPKTSAASVTEVEVQ